MSACADDARNPSFAVSQRNAIPDSSAFLFDPFSRAAAAAAHHLPVTFQVPHQFNRLRLPHQKFLVFDGKLDHSQQLMRSCTNQLVFNCESNEQKGEIFGNPLEKDGMSFRSHKHRLRCRDFCSTERLGTFASTYFFKLKKTKMNLGCTRLYST